MESNKASGKSDGVGGRRLSASGSSNTHNIKSNDFIISTGDVRIWYRGTKQQTLVQCL